MTVREFLAELWTDDPPGYLQFWDIRTKTSAYAPRPDVVGDALDGAPDVYMGVGLAPGMLGGRVRAKADQVVALAGLWLDIDIDGEGRKSDGVPNRYAAVELANAMCEPTIVIDSGYGVHAWHLFPEPWAFDGEQDRRKAARMAWQWYALHRAYAEARGWALGGTHDLARLLRLPGTFNAKRRPWQPVKVDWAGGPRYSVRGLARICAEAGMPPPEAKPADLNYNPDDTPEWVEQFLDLHAPVRRAYRHEFERPGWSLSEWDMAVATRAAKHLPDDANLAALIAAHRRAWGDEHKAHRVKYMADTIAKARANE